MLKPHKETHDIIRKQINYYRKEHKLTILALANMLDVPVSRLAKSLHSASTRSFPIEMIKKCAVIFNVSIDKLIK